MQHSLLTLVRLGIAIFWIFPPFSAAAENGCRRTWTLAELVKASKSLDGQVVCVRAVLRPLPKQDRSSTSVFVFEAVPTDAKLRQLDANRVGLIDWDREFGVDEALNRPESEGLLERASNRCSSTNKDDLSFIAEFRAVVEYRKGLTERAYSVLPPQVSAEKPRRTHYDTELVFLELFKATAIDYGAAGAGP